MIRSPLASKMTALLLGACLAAPAAAQQVGQVSLLIGSARVVKADGSRAVLRQGDAITVGDRIETSANGHVHLRFVDKGAASVRPDSVLEIQAYHYDPANPSANEVRLKVAQGISRSISGAATEADKSRFRLNTPLAAIGVRGTDFIVQSTPEQVRATVAAGAIVLTPLGGGCKADGLGPCLGRAGQQLSADMGRMMLELRQGEAAARVVPAAEVLLAAAPAKHEARTAEQAVAIAAAQPDSRSTLNDRAAAQMLAIAPVDARQLNTPPSMDAELLWGHWEWVKNPDPMYVERAQAEVGRHRTVGDGHSILYRKNGPASAEAVFQNPGVERLDFRLTRGEASYIEGGKAEAAQIHGATLSVDFLNRRFATALALSAPTTGSVELRLGGGIHSDGTFSVRDDGQWVAGAIATNLKEVGYWFERQVGGGKFRGRTLWGR